MTEGRFSSEGMTKVLLVYSVEMNVLSTYDTSEDELSGSSCRSRRVKLTKECVMRHSGGAVVLLLGRTAFDPCFPYGKLIHGGSILVVTYTGKASNIGGCVIPQRPSSLGQKPLLPTIRSYCSRGCRRIEHMSTGEYPNRSGDY